MMSSVLRSDLERLRAAVADAKSKKSTQKNQLILPSEDELSKLSYSLSLAVSEVTSRCLVNPTGEFQLDLPENAECNVFR